MRICIFYRVWNVRRAQRCEYRDERIPEPRTMFVNLAKIIFSWFWKILLETMLSTHWPETVWFLFSRVSAFARYSCVCVCEAADRTDSKCKFAKMQNFCYVRQKRLCVCAWTRKICRYFTKINAVCGRYWFDFQTLHRVYTLEYIHCSLNMTILKTYYKYLHIQRLLHERTFFNTSSDSLSTEILLI